MKMLILVLAWLGGINAAIPYSQNEDAKLTQENHRVQCFTYVSTFLAPVRSRVQASLLTLGEDDGKNTQTTFYTSMIHVDELNYSPTSNGHISQGVASGTFEPLYTSTPLVLSPLETNSPNLGNKKGAEIATGARRNFSTDTSHEGRISPNTDSHNGLDIDSGTSGTLLTDTLAPSTMATGDSNLGDMEEPDVASGTYGPFYTDTPILPTLAATHHFTSTDQQRPDVASGTYSPFYRDTPTLWKTKSTTGDGTSATIAVATSGSPVATETPFTSNN